MTTRTKHPTDRPTRLVAIDAPHFYAGLEYDGVQVVAAAPILHYMMGWSADRVRRYCVRKRWKLHLGPTSRPPK